MADHDVHSPSCRQIHKLKVASEATEEFVVRVLAYSIRSYARSCQKLLYQQLV